MFYNCSCDNGSFRLLKQPWLSTTLVVNNLGCQQPWFSSDPEDQGIEASATSLPTKGGSSFMNAEQLIGRKSNSFAGHLARTSFPQQNAHRPLTRDGPQSQCGSSPDQQRLFFFYPNLTKLQAHLTKLGLDDLGGKLV
jgi:hypothetical protein